MKYLFFILFLPIFVFAAPGDPPAQPPGQMPIVKPLYTLPEGVTPNLSGNVNNPEPEKEKQIVENEKLKQEQAVEVTEEKVNQVGKQDNSLVIIKNFFTKTKIFIVVTIIFALGLFINYKKQKNV